MRECESLDKELDILDKFFEVLKLFGAGILLFSPILALPVLELSRGNQESKISNTYPNIRIGECIIVTGDMIGEGSPSVGTKVTVVSKKDGKVDDIYGRYVYYESNEVIYKPYKMYDQDRVVPCD